MTDSWIEDIIEQWQIYGVELNEGIPVEKIKQAEIALNYNFPLQFHQFYSKVNGFKDLDWIENLFSIWPIEKIVEEYADNTNKNFIGFADYSLNEFKIGFLRNAEGVFKYEDSPEKIATTFEEALSLINADDESIY